MTFRCPDIGEYTVKSALSKSVDIDREVYSTALPPGRTWGQTCDNSPAWLSSGVSGSAFPPAELTRNSRENPDGEAANTIVPSGTQLPPLSPGASQSVTAAPPSLAIFFSFPSAKKPIHCPSGDKKGCLAPWVPARTVARGWLSERMYMRELWSAPWAAKARCVPSGDRATTEP